MKKTVVNDTTYWGPVFSVNEDDEMTIRYGRDDDLYDGDDWEFTYRFDKENTAAFLALMPAADERETVWKYMEEAFDLRLTLEEFCKEHGIHGTRTDFHEYPMEYFGPYEF